MVLVGGSECGNVTAIWCYILLDISSSPHGAMRNAGEFISRFPSCCNALLTGGYTQNSLDICNNFFCQRVLLAKLSECKIKVALFMHN
jgi:hypothetical protein